MPMWNVVVLLISSLLMMHRGHVVFGFIIQAVVILCCIDYPVFKNKPFKRKNDDVYLNMNMPDIQIVDNPMGYGKVYEWLYLEKEKWHFECKRIPRKQRKQYIKDQREDYRAQLRGPYDCHDYREFIVVAGIQWCVKNIIVYKDLNTYILLKHDV